MFLETRKGAPTMRAGTPDGGHLESSGAFAKPFFEGNHRQIIPQKQRPAPEAPAVAAIA
jgi:hypothetical protein